MASTQGFMDHVIEQACVGSRLPTRRMFGEYALYVDDLVVAFVCVFHSIPDSIPL